MNPKKRAFRVAVILVNYNSSRFTADCISSILKETSPEFSFQIIVVDNASRLEDIETLKMLPTRSSFQLIQSRINIGFSGANMMGVQVADADYYYFLNNDTVLLNDCLGILYSFMESCQDAGISSGEMFVSNGDYEYNFRYFPSLALKFLGSGVLRLLSPERFPSRHIRFTKPTRVDLVNGSSMFIRANAFEQLGGFDTNYFLYCEEEDIALRLYRAGHFTYIVPEARYKHFVSRSTENAGSIVNLPFLKEFHISLLYYFQKNYSFGYRVMIQFFYFFKTFRKFYQNKSYLSLAFFILRGAPARYSLRFQQQIKSL